tara:strand:- start:36 stop:269 length:234 start_codon:yes stop_codon:yes gene_type:complete
MRYTEEQYVESASIQARIIDELNTELKALKKVNETQAEQLILHGVSQLLPKRLSNIAYTVAKGNSYDGFVNWWDAQV